MSGLLDRGSWLRQVIRVRADPLEASLLRRHFTVLQYFINLLLAQEVPADIRELGVLPEADLLGHATYHVLFLRHLDVESLLLHLHGVVLDDLLIGMEEGLQDFGLDVGKAEAPGRLLAVIIALFQLLELVIHVLF